MGERMANEEMVKSSYWTSLFIELVLGDWGKRGSCMITFCSASFSQTLPQSLILITQMQLLCRRELCHLLSGDSEQ